MIVLKKLTKFQLGNFDKKKNNVKIYNIYFENCEMSFTFFSIENSISKIKHLKKFTKKELNGVV